jgi:hypothetical protein
MNGSGCHLTDPLFLKAMGLCWQRFHVFHRSTVRQGRLDGNRRAALVKKKQS